MSTSKILSLDKNKPTVTYTASAAGGWSSNTWASIRDHTVRLEELVKSQRRLMDSGLVSRSDEVASARRRFQFLTGPSGIEKLKEQLENGTVSCWRDESSDRDQSKLSLSNLEKGLQKVRCEDWRQAKEMRSIVGEVNYWRRVRQMRVRSRKTRSKE